MPRPCHVCGLPHRGKHLVDDCIGSLKSRVAELETEVEKVRQIPAYLFAERDRYREALGRIAGGTCHWKFIDIAREALEA